MIFAASFCMAMDEVFLASVPELSPDGKDLYFLWQSQIWKVNSDGGIALQVTKHPAGNSTPKISSDGKTLFFTSGRQDGWQIFSMPTTGGEVTKYTSHSDGYSLMDVYPDNKSALASVWRNYNGLIGRRIVKVSLDGSHRDKLIFDDYGDDATISPDGTKMLFTREGTGISAYRQGYKGSTASQLWMYDLTTEEFTPLRKERYGSRNPIWQPDGKGFYYCSEETGSYNIWQYDLATNKRKQLTFFKDSPILIPALSEDGETMVFRHLFNFYKFDPTDDEAPKKITIKSNYDSNEHQIQRRSFNKIWNENEFGVLEFTNDGLEFAFTTGGDLYVSDTVLRKPVKIDGGSGCMITELTFAPGFKTIYYLKDTGDRVNIWSAQVADDSKYWWENSEFKLTQISDWKADVSGLSISPDGKKLSYFKDRATLCTSNLDGSDEKIIMDGPYSSYYSWSPDNNYILATYQDSWRNFNVWIIDAHGNRKPYNLSRSPSYSGQASWSPDGKIITFVTVRSDKKVEFNWLYLDKELEEQTGDDRTLERAVKTMTGTRGKQHEKEPVNKDLKGHPNNPKDGKKVASKKTKSKDKTEITKNADGSININIDFDGLSDRVHTRVVNWGNPWGFFWSDDSNCLAFTASVNGRSGTHKLFLKEKNFSPSLMTSKAGWYTKWVKGKVLWMLDGHPAHLNTKFPVSVYQEIDKKKRQRFAFKYIWRKMRDDFCDPGMKNLDWDAILDKYVDQAENAVDQDAFNKLVGMLLGELNASHLGFTRTNTKRGWTRGGWKIETACFGVRYDDKYEGDGLKISSVITDSPADLDRSRLNVGDIITSINGVKIVPTTDVDKLTTVRLADAEFTLEIKNIDGEVRSIKISPISFSDCRALVTEQTLLDRRDIVDRESKNTLGYLNIAQMNNPSLRRFEKEVYSRGFDKDGLVIDVRNNPGGLISDYLLAILCHPQHAYTIPRNGEISYPKGYLPNVVWNKPIVVLCNQYSCSNAEIFTHAIKTLKRGKVVGIETQACVISAPKQDILDIGTLRTPDRAWWPMHSLVDMEAQGAVPDYTIWPEPGDMPKGVDKQLDKAVELLLEDVKNEKEKPKLHRHGYPRK